jgi:hypothetical protein
MSMSIAALPKLLVHLGTLAKVLPWGLAQSPPWTVVDVVVQDEFTHDVILGAEGVKEALVLDCT